MEKTVQLRGLTTISYWADDLKAAKKWYSDVLGVEPYFVRPDVENPAYVEFRIGDYQHELGIIDRKYAPPMPTGPAGQIAYWHVDDIEESLKRLIALGATAYGPITEYGVGFVTASVIDPFGNILGIMYNKHYLEILDKAGK
ncbi:VOC family protein [Pedobacter sp. UBA5917]|jgi:predicted enzyme related to lactoylglutathione lyase|uniref:VOC family protein n=1 Tax=Pedobacter sp. UBA5917 TaxID=1947061 RepID=UPI0025D9750A|nr:VOC family protein [Pedobacter sp. UBA5917]